MSEFSNIDIKDIIYFDRVLSPKENGDLKRYFSTWSLTVKEYAIFQIKEMPFY